MCVCLKSLKLHLVVVISFTSDGEGLMVIVYMRSALASIDLFYIDHIIIISDSVTYTYNKYIIQSSWKINIRITRTS